MIRRPAAHSFWLIPQHEHALLAGQLARHFGNERFAPPSPYGPTVEAIDLHDIGWPEHDNEPTLNARGLPLHIFEAPYPLSISLWSAAVEHFGMARPYAALLVSMHVLGLSAITLSRMASPTRAAMFEINKFQHRQCEIQERLRASLGLSTELPLTLGVAAPGASEADDLLAFNFRILTAVDRLSLALCCGDHLFPSIDDLLPRPGAEPLSMQIEMPDPATMVLDPWPFDMPELSFDVQAKRVSCQPFESAEAFRRAYQAAEVGTVRLGLRGGRMKDEG